MEDDNGLNATADSSQTVLGNAPPAGTEPQAPEGSAQTQAEGSVAPKWTEQLPREYRDKFAGYESYKDFVAAAAEAIPLKNTAIVKPAEDAPSEEWDRFYAAVGRPDDPTGYDIEGDGIVDEFKTAAHKLGLTQQQAKELYKWYGEAQSAVAEKATKEAAESVEKVVSELKSEWGESYDSNMKAIERFKRRYGTEELARELQNPLIGNNMNLIKALAKAGADLAPDSLVEGRPAQPQPNTMGFDYGAMRDMFNPPKMTRG